MPRKHIVNTEESDNIIRQCYPLGGADACMPHLPGRTRAAIRTRAAQLGVYVLVRTVYGRKCKKRPADPTPAEIRAMCEKFRETWPESRFRGIQEEEKW